MSVLHRPAWSVARQLHHILAP